jgi:hypothetical protein
METHKLSQDEKVPKEMEPKDAIDAPESLV